jgi:oligoendopeptidase F
LGAAYQEALWKGLYEERWVDRYENLRKRSGAYSSSAYDGLPFILMNYKGTLEGVFTLAHEAGHSMHSLYAKRHQPYPYAGYPIFLAEVASIFNEQLLLRHLQGLAQDPLEKVRLVNHELESLRNTLFRQTLFAEFEMKLYEWAEEGRPLTPGLLKETFTTLNQAYYGPDLACSEELSMEWARIPHFYTPFYVYQYATGMSAAYALVKTALSSDQGREAYLGFLKSGDSQGPLETLSKAGVNMKERGSIEMALQRFKFLVEQLQNSMGLLKGSCKSH